MGWYAICSIATGQAVAFDDGVPAVAALAAKGLTYAPIARQPVTGEHYDPVSKSVMPDDPTYRIAAMNAQRATLAAAITALGGVVV